MLYSAPAVPSGSDPSSNIFTWGGTCAADQSPCPLTFNAISSTKGLTASTARSSRLREPTGNDAFGRVSENGANRVPRPAERITPHTPTPLTIASSRPSAPDRSVPVEASGVKPTDPPAQVEPVCLKRRTGAAGQESGDGMLDALPDRVGLDQDELGDDFTGMDGGRVHGGSPSWLMEIRRARTRLASSR